MKLVSVETPEKSVCKMTFSATAEELETASNAVYERTRASYTIKGFAKGEADRAQIEADRGEHTFWYDAINDLMDKDVPALYDAAMKEHGFKPVDEPSYDLVSVKKDEGFVATATTALQPELTLTQTTGFKVECVTPAVTDKEIDAVLERRRAAAGPPPRPRILFSNSIIRAAQQSVKQEKTASVKISAFSRWAIAPMCAAGYNIYICCFCSPARRGC